MARGRPRTTGARRSDGRPAAPRRVPANDRVLARGAWYADRFGARVVGDTHDAIGRAWAAGLLEQPRHDPAVLRDIGRRYGALHATVFARLGIQVPEHDRVRGSGAGVWDDPAGERYGRLDRLARTAGSKARLALHKLCVEGSPDENPRWLERLIQARAHKAPPDPRDARILAQAIAALVAMVDGQAGAGATATVVLADPTQKG